ncbi:hypothetical protein ABW20_dc0106850 [Dactylellina cionopaga]|nr:hypothetical protein ABW20_dc0106850 [Dactylellina cionopaga]
MKSQKFDALNITLFDILQSNRDIYDDSVLRVQFCLGALAEEVIINQKLHITGFDADQIWLQTKELLRKIANSTGAPYPNDVTRDLSSKRKAKATNYESDKPVKCSSTFDIGSEQLNSSDYESSEELGSDSDTNTPGMKAQTSPSKIVSDRLDKDILSTKSRDTRRGDNRFTGKLNDEFFSLEKFNLETERLERTDELGRLGGELDIGINWHADPGEQINGSESSGGEDIATIGGSKREVMYADFFAPPDGDLSELDLRSSNELWRSHPMASDLGSNSDIVDMMEGVQRDLFEDLAADQLQRDQSHSSDDSPHRPVTKSSSHQKVQAQLRDQIRNLEKQNINKQEWTLSGETDSQQRPFNSLLQEDLDFERIGKPVPVVTQDTTTRLEDVIKARILAERFDEIQRRSLEFKERFHRRATELDDSKSGMGLADAYEKDQLAKIDLANQLDTPIAKLNILKNEITELFSMASEQLDALSSWHFTPKVPKSTLSVVQDTRTIGMEEANINIGSFLVSDTTTLAPQEVYNPASTEHQLMGIVKTSGIPVSTLEIERSHRAKERRRRKKTILMSKKDDGTPSKRKELLKTLQDGNVSIIREDGQPTSISGKTGDGNLVSSGTRVKL